MTKIEWLKLAIRDVKRHPDNAIKYINEVIELEALSKPSVVSEEEIKEMIGKNYQYLYNNGWEYFKKMLSREFYNLITKGV